MQQLGDTVGSNTPTLTPTASSTGLGGPNRDEGFLVNGLGNMSLGTAISNQNSPRRARNAFSSWDEAQSYPATAPIGSQRNVSIGPDHGNPDRVLSRQPRGPAPERNHGFRRQNGHGGRGSDEMRNGPPITVE